MSALTSDRASRDEKLRKPSTLADAAGGDSVDLRDALRKNDARLSFLLDATAFGTWELDVGAPERSSPTRSLKHDQLFGYENGREDWSYDIFLEHVIPEDRPLVDERFNRALNETGQWEFECRIRRVNDHAVRWIWASGRLVQEDGRPRWILGLVQDVTKRKLLEEDLRTSRVQESSRAEELKALMDSVPAMVFLAEDPGCRVISGNRQAYEFWALPPGANLSTEPGAPGKTAGARFLQDGEELQPDRLPAQRAVRGERVTQEEFEIRFNDGRSRYLLVNAIALHDQKGKIRGALGAMMDITERRKTEERLQELNQNLEQRVAERTVELENRAAQLQLMSDALTETEQRERRRLAKLLHDDLQQILVAAKMRLGAVAHADGGGPQERPAIVETKELLRDAIETARNLSSELAPQVLYDLGLGPALDWLARWTVEKYELKVAVECDDSAVIENEQLRVLVFEAVRELLLNVVKHAGTGQASVCLRREKEWLCVTVEDKGRGFDPKEEKKRPTVGGHGLFSIEQRLELLGGRVKVDSAPARGTRVEITVCAGQSPSEMLGSKFASVLSGAPARRVVDRSIRILLVDDHEILRRGLADLIEAEEDLTIVGEAASGEEGVAKARELRPDLVMMDITLPGISGIEATRQLKRELPNIHVVGLSIHQASDVAEGMKRAGASAYLCKNEPSKDLVETIRSLVVAA